MRSFLKILFLFLIISGQLSAKESSVFISGAVYNKPIYQDKPAYTLGLGYSARIVDKFKVSISGSLLSEHKNYEGVFFSYVGTPDTNMYFVNIWEKVVYFIPDISLSYSILNHKKMNLGIGIGDQILFQCYYSNSVDFMNRNSDAYSDSKFYNKGNYFKLFIDCDYHLSQKIKLNIQPFYMIGNESDNYGFAMTINYKFLK